MKNNHSEMKAMFIIVNAGFSSEVMEIAREAGVKGATIINARGEIVPHKSFMGITLDSEKEMILTLVDAGMETKVMKAIEEKAGFHSLAHSLCFSMPVEKTTVINDFPIIEMEED